MQCWLCNSPINLYLLTCTPAQNEHLVPCWKVPNCHNCWWNRLWKVNAGSYLIIVGCSSYTIMFVQTQRDRHVTQSSNLIEHKPNKLNATLYQADWVIIWWIEFVVFKAYFTISSKRTYLPETRKTIHRQYYSNCSWQLPPYCIAMPISIAKACRFDSCQRTYRWWMFPAWISRRQRQAENHILKYNLCLCTAMYVIPCVSFLHL